jgi:pyruvate dehydrogenase E2 component (dihydrolipoamide acetyltransferase)
MPTNILMPALSPTMEKGNLAKWLKKEGDAIKSGDVIAEIETDKATMEVEAVDEGILAKILVPAGTADVPVNQLIALIAGEGEDPKSVTAGGPPPAPKAPAQAAETLTAAASSVSEQAIKNAAAADKPPTGDTPPRAPAANEQALAGEKGYGVTPGAAPVHAGVNGSGGGRVFASPLARRIASQNGIDLNAIKGSGPHGRIVEADVKAAMAAPKAPQAAAPAAAQGQPAPAAPAAQAPAAAPTGMADEAIKKMFAPGSYEEIPHDSMRKVIARRLLESKQTVPHFYLTVDTQLDALLALREQLNAAAPQKDGKPAYKLSVNDMVIKAMAMALKAVPDANVTWTGEAMLKHKHADVGVAVSIPGGLITPVIRDACHKTLSAISNEMKDMASRAKARKLKPEEYQGGTTAISNLGMFGVKDFCAVINPPHATILAVGAGEKRPVVKTDGSLGVATVMSVTLSTDHRAVDGALGAELLQAFKGYIESPMGMLV